MSVVPTQNAEIRIIPFPGKPLEYHSTEQSKTLFPGVQHGFLLGPENYLLEPVIQWAVNGTAPQGALPILFYGALGTGRSHLLRGILDAWRKNRKDASERHKSYYLPAVDFARHYTEAVHTKTTDDFRKRYREASLLLIDDLDELKERHNIQEELQYILDAQSLSGGTSVFTAANFPFEPGQFSESLTARLIGGTTLPVFLPGVAVRQKLLLDLSVSFRVPLEGSVLEMLAEQWTFSFPALYGHFAQMYFEAEAAKKKLDTGFIRRFVKQHAEKVRPKIETIVKKTAKHFSLKVSDLTGTSRNKTIALARSVAVYLAKQQTEMTLKDIGIHFGNRDPSTVRNMLRRVQKELPTDTLLRDHLFQLGLS